ncbi:hypothetical protein [Sphingomicrobium sediminis]|uniref:Uncharacterized protein n=1 Tax=Sphingomicrobium sediminis TaxID=2950949 RepID=A0A9X2J452_9SPHN|nr:hypothetical protein [Sphingomicrobium sediminis]MCM8557996.1 hypothetical protein [Sphingomicrobium sediminis]
MKLVALASALAAAVAAPAAAQEVPAEPAFMVADNRISVPDEGIALVIPEDAVYVGATRWPLYDIVDAEQHVFVRTDEGGLVEEYWLVQFETYFDHVDANYTYDETEPTSLEIGDRTWWTRPIFTSGRPNEVRPGSDTEMFGKIIAQAGYRMPMWLAGVRMVYMPGEDRRSEIMIIHGANLDGVATTMAERFRAGEDGVKWTDFYGPMIERASLSFTIAPLDAE